MEKIENKQQPEKAELGFRIFTSRFSNPALGEMAAAKVRITLYHPRFKLKYELADSMKELAPNKAMLECQDRSEFERLYWSRLDQLGVDWIIDRLKRISEGHEGADVVLLCFEDVHKPGQWCHRQCLADWIERKIGVKIKEILISTPGCG